MLISIPKATVNSTNPINDTLFSIKQLLQSDRAVAQNNQLASSTIDHGRRQPAWGLSRSTAAHQCAQKQQWGFGPAATDYPLANHFRCKLFTTLPNSSPELGFAINSSAPNSRALIRSLMHLLAFRRHAVGEGYGAGGPCFGKTSLLVSNPSAAAFETNWFLNSG